MQAASNLFSQRGFNGAVVVRRRRERHAYDGVLYATRLQWGRRRETTERSPSTENTRRPGLGFNGAVVVRRRRGVVPGDALANERFASMGPSS